MSLHKLNEQYTMIYFIKGLREIYLTNIYNCTFTDVTTNHLA